MEEKAEGAVTLRAALVMVVVLQTMRDTVLDVSRKLMKKKVKLEIKANWKTLVS